MNHSVTSRGAAARRAKVHCIVGVPGKPRDRAQKLDGADLGYAIVVSK